MLKNSGFELGDVAWNCAGVTGQFATDTRDSSPLLVMRWTPSQPALQNDFDPIWRQQHINKLLGTGAFSYPVQLVRSTNETVGLTPWFDGLPLSTTLLSRNLSLESILDLLIDVSASLHSLHVAGGFHGHLGLDSILWSEGSRKVRFCDAGFLSFPILPTLVHPDAENRSKKLYASPEATGRMGQSVDERSDLYSMGAILYRLLCHSPPFPNRSPLELAHAHLALTPTPPCEINPNIPTVLSDIAMRLLSKLPEARYRSAEGVRHDLERCQKTFRKNSGPPSFELGKYDTPARFRPTDKLFGRQEECAQLEQAYDACKSNDRALVLVSGYSGIGKTSLVLRLRHHVIDDGGFFVSAKFEQSATQQPLVGLSSIVRQLSEHILALPEQQMSMWRTKIKTKLGASAVILAGLSPEMQLLLNVESNASLTSSEGARSRLIYALERFIALFSNSSSPLVLFLDDMQWMDLASTEIFEHLFNNSKLPFVLMITAYRDQELQNNSPAKKFVENAIQDRAINIRLGALSEIDIRNFLEESIGSNSFELEQVARVLLRKSGGNPFFFRTLTASFERDHLLKFDLDARCWRFDLEAMEQLQVSEEIAQHLVAELHAYPIDCQLLLRDLACLGGRVSLNLLALITERSPNDCLRTLATPLADGMVLRHRNRKSAETFRMAHDQIEYVAARLKLGTTRKERHAAIARRMVDKDVTDAFRVIEQVERGISYVSALFEPRDLAKLYLEAARSAFDTTAYVMAEHYVERGVRFLEHCSWPDSHELFISKHRLKAQLEYQKGRSKNSQNEIELARVHCKTDEEHCEFATMLIIQKTMSNEYSEALTIGFEALERLDYKLPDEQYSEYLQSEIDILLKTPVETEFEKLIQLPLATNTRIKLIARLLVELVPPSYFSDTTLNNLIAAKMTTLSLEHGITPEGCKGMANLATALIEKDEYSKGYLFGELALELIQRNNFEQIRPRVLYTFYAGINHWKNPLANSVEMFEHGHQLCLQNGYRDYAGYMLSLGRCQSEIFLARPIQEFHVEVNRSLAFARETKNGLAEHLSLATSMALTHLEGGSESSSSFDNSDITELNLLKAIRKNKGKQRLVECFYFVVKAMNFVFMNHLKLARDSIEAAYACRDAIAAPMTLPMLHFFRALIQVEILVESGDPFSPQRISRTNIPEDLKLLSTWSNESPDNFKHCHLMVQAALERYSGHTQQSINTYSEACNAAQVAGYRQFEGFAHLRLFNIWLESEQQYYALHHLSAARACFKSWGAERLVSQLDSMASQMQFHRRLYGGNRSFPENYSQSTDELDLNSFLNIVQRLSIQVDDFEILKNELATMLLQHMGAQRTVLFLNNNSELRVVLSVDAERESVFKTVTDYPSTFVNLAARSGEIIELSEYESRLPTSDLSQLRHSGIVSALCLPLVQRGTLEGVVYIENRINRMDLSLSKRKQLTTLASLAALAIRNSLLYEERDKEVQERTKDLAKLNHELESRVNQQVEEISKLARLKPFLSPQVARMALSTRSDDLLKSHKAQVAVLFCDLRNFTAFSEALDAERTMRFLQEYHLRLDAMFAKYDATLDHRAGDGVMVFLGDPFPEISVEVSVHKAVQLATDLQASIRTLLDENNFQGSNLGFGIGISFGPATMGLIGQEWRADYAATGRFVNLASRLCDQALDGQILLDEFAQRMLPDNVITKKLPAIYLKGFSEPILVYQLLTNLTH